MSQFNFQAIGTTWQIDVYRELSEAEEAALLSRIKDRIDIFDKVYSRFRDDSLVTEMSKKSGIYGLPPDAEAMMSLYYDLYQKTDGLVTPLIGNLISDAGYDAKYSLQQKGELKVPPEWDEAIEYQAPSSTVLGSSPKNPTLIIKKPVLLDFGAAGKGYLVDLVAEVLEAGGVAEYCINAGGDILYKNKTPIRVGLEDPENTDQVVGVCVLLGGSIAGSAGSRRKWGKFTHIINPKTLASPPDIIAVWVTAKTALLADALTTCLFFVPAGTLTDTYDFEYVLIRKDRSFDKSEHFPGELFR